MHAQYRYMYMYLDNVLTPDIWNPYRNVAAELNSKCSVVVIRLPTQVHDEPLAVQGAWQAVQPTTSIANMMNSMVKWCSNAWTRQEDQNHEV